MRVFRRILCPVDFSDTSRHALDYAVTFAQAFDSELVLMHVSPDIGGAYSTFLPGISMHGMQQHNDVEAEFDEFTSYLPGDFKKVIRTGTPYLEILQYARSGKFDLIILGARGHSTFERLFLGSTGENVVRYSEVPVLTVHAKPHRPAIRRILVPIDFSETSYSIVPVVATLARAFKARIDLLHIVEMGHNVSPAEQEKEYAYFESVKDRLASQWELPEAFSKVETRKFIRHHVGSAGYGILAFAQDWDADLIVMATHGHSGFPWMLLGSVAEKVIRIAPLPVLSVRAIHDSLLDESDVAMLARR